MQEVNGTVILPPFSIPWLDFFNLVQDTKMPAIISFLNKLFCSCGMYYKCFTIVTYDRNDSGQYYKTTILIVIDDLSLS